MTIIFDFLLFTSTALIFSITILCILLYHRVSDNYLRGFLGVLFPLMLQLGLSMINTYIKRTIPTSDFGRIYPTFALMATFLSVLSSTAVLFFLSRYLTDLLPVTDKQKVLSYRIINLISLVYLFFSLFAVFFINQGDWVSAFDLVLERLFLAGSLLLSVHGIVSLFYIRNAKNREHENLLRWISVTFLPLIPFFILDTLYFQKFAFKMTYISYVLFCVSIYLFISRHYIRKYEPEPGRAIQAEAGKLIREGFSKREVEIIKLVIEGRTNKEIGELLFISINTVKTHIKNIYTKLKISNRIQLIHKVTNLG